MSIAKTVVIYLIGFSGTGKYTVAKEISKFGYRIVDNHLINNPILSLQSLSELNGITPIPKFVWDTIDKIRNIVLEFVQTDNNSNYVFTNELLETDTDRNIYNKILNAALKRNSIFIPVKLIISAEELAKRIISPERQQRFKSTNINEAYSLKKSLTIIHENLLEIEITNLTAHTVAKRILFHAEKLLENSY